HQPVLHSFPTRRSSDLSSSPCSISAFCWSAVMTRGLDTTLPLPSASRADISRFRNRSADAPKSDKAKVPGLKPLTPVAGKFTKRSEEHTSELQSPCNLV